MKKQIKKKWNKPKIISTLSIKKTMGIAVMGLMDGGTAQDMWRS